VAAATVVAVVAATVLVEVAATTVLVEVAATTAVAAVAAAGGGGDGGGGTDASTEMAGTGAVDEAATGERTEGSAAPLRCTALASTSETRAEAELSAAEAPLMYSSTAVVELGCSATCSVEASCVRMSECMTALSSTSTSSQSGNLPLAVREANAVAGIFPPQLAT